ncbi:MAG TPA: hypothetical protein VEQ85_12700 [Lacipirellulaceae bacterium]|nr:hypothetical protein [Lacipirellulaceae bacterium]
MSTPAPLQLFVHCPQCQERLGVRQEDFGRKARCAKCRSVFTLAARPGAPGGAPRDATPVRDPAARALVTFDCSLCQTRITARAGDVGRKVECPDCGRKNVIPPPPKPKASKAPPALEGEQFELWGVDDKPWESAESAPKLHPVTCGLCETLMYATEAQIGSPLRCPDCGAATVAKRSRGAPAPRLAPQVGRDYELDPESAPTPRYVPLPVAVRDAELHAHARATTVGPDGRLIVKKEETIERPVMPKNPLITGVWRMLATQEVIARWIMISILFGLAAWFITDSLLTPVKSVAAIAGIFLMLIGVGMLILWLTFAGPTFLTILGESACGHDRIHDAPSWSPLEWMGECVQVAASIGAAGLAGACVGWGATAALGAAGAVLPGEALAVVVAVGPVIVFPLALLGTLIENAALGVVSPRLLSTLRKCPGPWLLFYAESVLLVGGAMGASYAVVAFGGPMGRAAMPLIVMGAAVVYMRLAGRLAWWISEATAEEDDAEFRDEAAAAHPHLAAARRAEHERKRLGDAE